MARTGRTIGIAMLALVVTVVPSIAEDDDELRGNVELLYRDVTQNGSEEKYNEDFDGLSSGLRLSRLELDWFGIDSSVADFMRVEADGLGGDPYERAVIRLGRKDVYELRASYRSQRYVYDLFRVVDDLDGSAWNSKRRIGDLGLTIQAGDHAEVFVEYQRVERDGTSVFLNDVNTQLYRMEVPLDQNVQRFSVGGKFAIGRVDILFRQMLRRYDYRFDRRTSDDAGLFEENLAALDSYAWLQDDDGNTDLTTLTVSTPIGRRVHLTASAFGTLLGKEQFTSRVRLDAEGDSFRGRCSVTGDVCSGSDPCDTGVPGNTCIPDPFEVSDGTSRADVEGEYVVLDADLSVSILDNLEFHFQGRTLEREVEAHHLRDLDGNGVPDDLEGTVNDDVPGSTTEVETSIDTLTGLFDWAPIRGYRFRVGYRTIARSLERSGFEYGTTEYRNTSFESDPDDTLILGMVLEPLDWLRVDADYEQGDIAQAFTAVAPMETDRLRLGVRFVPQSDLRIDLGYLDYDNENTGADFRESDDCGGPDADIDRGCWASRSQGTSLSASLWHDVGRNVRYWVRWARHDTESDVRIRYDTEEFFNSAENGNSIYENVTDSFAGQLDLRWSDRWDLFLRGRINQSDGSNRVDGDTFSTTFALLQDFADLEAGLTYTFPRGVFVGGRYRVFDYDDANGRLDYDGSIATLVAGLRF